MAELPKVIAVTEIHRTIKPGKHADKAKGIPAVRPEVKIIAPGSVFVPASHDEYLKLLRLEAIRLPDPDEKIAVPFAHVQAEADVNQTEPKAKAKAKTSKPKAAAKPVEKMTAKELEAHAGSKSYVLPDDWQSMSIDSKREWIELKDGDALV